MTRHVFAMICAAVLFGVAAPSAAAEDGAGPVPGASSGDFQDCPSLPVGQKPGSWFCLVAKTIGGSIQLGTVTEQISQPITVTFAIGPTNGYLYGNVRAVPLPVPGGLLGIPGTENWPGLDVQAIAQGTGLVGKGSKPGNIQLGLKLKLAHPVLGDSCYIGDDQHPITLDLTYGRTNPPPPNQPISGKPPKPVQGGGLAITYVDNAFSVPKARGCGLLLPWLAGCGELDPILNGRVQLPAAAGRNTAIFDQIVQLKSYKDLPPAS
ncbi:hypothetical protein F0L68_19475 [Solihabitans fulvus]|uniref:Secreted protein n=1 Tax=Solihabitans fulvus TaxID=1892852 RepID=A0A5B2XB92_9PSEU|nr:hypothetical protein [Solihabitans fulvus]KAA2260978.1 hypothetical protein F0L68_19475 [Solihabitans fulvus]